MEQVAKLLEQLAAKLGTTVEYLWAVLVKQAQVEAIANLIWFVILLIVGSVGIPKTRKWMKTLKKDSWGDYEVEHIFAIVGLTIFFVLVIVFIPITLIDGIKYLINPEYYALNEILKVLK